MRRLQLLFVALATLSFVALYSCQNTGKTEEKAVEEKTEEVVEEEVMEEEMVTDSTEMEAEEAMEEEGEATEHGEGR